MQVPPEKFFGGERNCIGDQNAHVVVHAHKGDEFGQRDDHPFVLVDRFATFFNGANHKERERGSYRQE
jgi:hypothetical protein